MESGGGHPMAHQDRRRHLSPNLRAFLNQLLVNLGSAAGYEMGVAGKVLLAAALVSARMVHGVRKLRRGYM